MNVDRLPRAPTQFPERKIAEGAYQKQNGKWSSQHFPGHEFESLDEFRAAKKQRAERRKEYSTQNGL